MRDKKLKGLYKIGLIWLIAAALLGMPGAARADFHDAASAGEMTKTKSVSKYGMLPVYGRDIEDGTYTVKVKTSSQFFKIMDAELTVAGDELSAVLRLDSYSYTHVYRGTAAEAAAEERTEEDYIPEVKDAEGYVTFTISLDALNKPIDLAAFSKKKQKWYDRQILIDASDLPSEALKIELPDYDKIEKAMEAYEASEGSQPEDSSEADAALDSGTGSAKTGSAKTDYGEESMTDAQGGAGGLDAYAAADAMRIDLEDGEYSVEVNMTGGSGRASVSSPTYLIVRDGKAYAHLIWSSSYYDYMIVGGQKYLNESTDGGNSTFTIPIAAFDQILPVIADTTAMGDPVPIEYSLTFYEETVGERGLIPQVAAKKVLIFGAIIIVFGAVINFFVKRKYYK